ncbi:MAG: hypothetical protein LBT97_01325 [Planctomycetota bacterium]|jgi:hypothetical protein|nr:hypothetical protein [Planctomycetota bacterium]
MSKLSAVLSKKVPIPGLDFSSQQFSCGLEMELPGDQTQDNIRQNIRKLYALLHAAIDGEIRDAAANPPAFMPAIRNAPRNPGEAGANRWRGHSHGSSRPGRWSKPGGNSRNDGGRPGRASQAQIKAVFAIARSNGMERGVLREMLEDRFNVSQPDDLSVRQASELIDALKDDGGRE